MKCFTELVTDFLPNTFVIKIKSSFFKAVLVLFTTFCIYEIVTGDIHHENAFIFHLCHHFKITKLFVMVTIFFPIVPNENDTKSAQHTY